MHNSRDSLLKHRYWAKCEHTSALKWEVTIELWTDWSAVTHTCSSESSWSPIALKSYCLSYLLEWCGINTELTHVTDVLISSSISLMSCYAITVWGFRDHLCLSMSLRGNLLTAQAVNLKLALSQLHWNSWRKFWGGPVLLETTKSIIPVKWNFQELLYASSAFWGPFLQNQPRLWPCLQIPFSSCSRKPTRTMWAQYQGFGTTNFFSDRTKLRDTIDIGHMSRGRTSMWYS